MRHPQLLNIIIVVFLLSACVSVNSVRLPQPCEGNEQSSIILQKIPNPTATDLLLQLANLEALKHGAYSAEEALKTVMVLENAILHGVTYNYLACLAYEKFAKINEEYQAEIFLLSQYVQVFENIELEISDCDKALLLYHLGKQKQVITFYL